MIARTILVIMAIMIGIRTAIIMIIIIRFIRVIGMIKMALITTCSNNNNETTNQKCFFEGSHCFTES